MSDITPEQRKALEEEKKKSSQADRIVALASEVELFHNHEAFVTVPVADHHETHLLRSKGARRWFAARFYKEHSKAPSSQALQDGLGVLEGQALYEGPQIPVHVRLAEHDGAIYLDRGDESWSAIRITADGWQEVSDPPVRFRRPRGLLALPQPRRGGSLADLGKIINVGSRADRMLVIAWEIAALRWKGPFPVMDLLGEQGSAKSTDARTLRSLVDPNAAPIRAEPREPRDLVIAANNGWMIALDNLSTLAPWLSDGICRLATGGGFATRALYSDDEEIIFDAQRPVILNGITEHASRGDLLDRSIIIYQPPIPERKRRPERELKRRLDAARPHLLGALLDGVACAIRNLDDVELDSLPRMADFAEWAVAAAPTLGWKPKTFLDAYSENREAAHEISLEASPIVAPLRALVANDEFEGTASELLSKLVDEVDDRVARSRPWPKNASALGGALRRLAPDLRAVGIEVELPKGRRHGRIYRIRTVPKSDVPDDPAVPAGTHGEDAEDGGDADSPTQSDGHDPDGVDDLQRLGIDQLDRTPGAGE